MKTKIGIMAAILFLAATPSAFSYDVTSDPDATMNQQQKMGPNVRSYRLWNRTINLKGANYGRYGHYGRYAHYRHRYWR